MQARFTRALDKLQIAGTYVGMPTVRHIRGILWEVRVRDQTGSYRLFFGVASDAMSLEWHVVGSKRVTASRNACTIGQNAKWRPT